MSKVRLVFFGRFADAMGRAREVDLEPGVDTIAKLKGRLSERDATFAEAVAGATMKTALNERIVEPDAAIADGDEIAFLPPFSGG